jgi:hypothetical protein
VAPSGSSHANIARLSPTARVSAPERSTLGNFSARSLSAPNGVSVLAPAVEIVTIRAPGRFNIEVLNAR